MRVRVLTTGGTIEGFEYTDEKFKNKRTASIKEMLESLGLKSSYSITKLFAKDSRFITDRDRTVLADEIKHCAEDKIIITHGTESMVETATFIGKLNIKKTIVFVGSFISGLEAKSDAISNLSFSFSEVLKLEPGTYIAFHDTIFNWDNVKKNREAKRFETLINN
ncbi:hypothetical protein WH52_10815 [Tenacibaculum holothuriorum]|uniref:L-asparaginase N-terminal domain-containing protein n=2 Tax=Tenacibaculum holothuriorum TaxID=1635173 RepID=A0A1Y2PD37_9FLAO|nr:hypothetical protein WH52_10815 [Tenacibaculum holothuriorum]